MLLSNRPMGRDADATCRVEVLEPEVGRGSLGEPHAEPPPQTAFGERRPVRQPSMERRK